MGARTGVAASTTLWVAENQACSARFRVEPCDLAPEPWAQVACLFFPKVVLRTSFAERVPCRTAVSAADGGCPRAPQSHPQPGRILLGPGARFCANPSGLGTAGSPGGYFNSQFRGDLMKARER